MQDVVEYSSYEEFAAARGARLASGWRIASVTDVPQRAGVGRFVALGLGAIVLKPKPHVLVVWERTQT